MRYSFKPVLWIIFLIGLLILIFNVPAAQKVAAQQPTGSVPTVTSTPTGPTIKVTYPEQINVRSGPSSFLYAPIGVLLTGETASALGRSPGGDWIQIHYDGVPGNVGWVYAPLVGLSANSGLPIVEPPPTPTPATTPTIDPTLAAAFIPQLTATRLPTFTPPRAARNPDLRKCWSKDWRYPAWIGNQPPGSGRWLWVFDIVLAWALKSQV